MDQTPQLFLESGFDNPQIQMGIPSLVGDKLNGHALTTNTFIPLITFP